MREVHRRLRVRRTVGSHGDGVAPGKTRSLCTLISYLQLTCEVKVLVSQFCPTLCNPMDCSPPGSSVHGILQARVLEWVGMPSSSCQGCFLFKNITRSNCQIVPNVKFHPPNPEPLLLTCVLHQYWLVPACFLVFNPITYTHVHAHKHTNKFTDTHTHTLQFHLPSLVSALALPHMIPIPALNIFPFTTEYKETSYFPPPGNGNPSYIWI